MSAHALRLIGMIGGISWKSTAHYYALMNRIARRRLGGQHSARLLLWSYDFAPIAAQQEAGEWKALTAEMIDAAHRLEDAGAEGLVITANTMHLMADDVQAAIGIPLIHIVDATAAALQANFAKRPLLAATRFTMEKPFWRDRLSQQGVESIVPEPEDRTRLHAIIFEELVQGVFRPEARQWLLDLTEREHKERGIDSVILGCTELGLLAPVETFALPAFDTAEIHAEAAMDFAIGTAA